MCFERDSAWCGVYDLAAFRQGEAGHDNVVVTCSSAFCRDYGAVVFRGYFVDDADKAFGPAVFVVVGFCWRRRGSVAVAGVGEAGLDVGDSG